MNGANLLVAALENFVLDATPLSQDSPTIPAARSMPAPIGHAQPRARDFSPNSQANQAEQSGLRLSTGNSRN
jgi:hypothetical protein